MVDLADEEEDDLEPEVDMDMDWSETLDDNLTPSQHSQPSRNTQEEVRSKLFLHYHSVCQQENLFSLIDEFCLSTEGGEWVKYLDL